MNIKDAVDWLQKQIQRDRKLAAKEKARVEKSARPQRSGAEPTPARPLFHPPGPIPQIPRGLSALRAGPSLPWNPERLCRRRKRKKKQEDIK